MTGIFILLILCISFGFAACMTFNAMANGKMWERIIGVVTTCLIGILVVATYFACIENTRIQTMQDYFEGKVEVIEQVDTVRTFKFN